MDFGSSIYKVKPGLKSYLFISDYYNVLDELVSRSLLCDYINYLNHPFLSSDLDKIMGVSEDRQSIVVNMEGLNLQEYSLLNSFLERPKTKNLSLILTGSNDPPSEIRAIVSKQGLCVYGDSPNTLLSQKHLSEWIGDECKIHVSDAYKVAQSLDWNLGSILWTIKSYQAVSNFQVVDRSTSQKIMNKIAFQDPITSAFNSTVSKKRLEAKSFAAELNLDQRQKFIDRLQDFVEGISLVSEAVRSETSDKKIAAAAGRSINDVIYMRPFISRYSFSTLAKCEKLIKFAQEHIEQKEVAETVALLWAS